MSTHLRILPAALALAGADALLAPAAGFAVSGKSLPLSEREVRVFNNFADPQANDHATPDAQFPGATGAALAIWKAAAEWGSALHGDGSGDATQPELGSGALSLPIADNPAAAGLALFGQAALLDPGAPAGVAFSDALAIVLCP